MPVTEFSATRVRDYNVSSIMDPATPAGAVLYRAYTGVTSHPKGPMRAYYGVGHDDPSILWAFFDFDSVQHHTDFARDYALQCIPGLQDLMAESIFMSHVPLTQFSTNSSHIHHNTPGISALLAPATVVIQLYFHSSISDSEKRAAKTSIRGLIERYVCPSHAVDGDEDVAVGWSVESDVAIMSSERTAQAGPQATQQQGGGMMAAVYGILIGWESETAAGRWREGSDGIDFVAQVKGLAGVLGLKVEIVELRCHHKVARGDGSG